MWKAFRCKKSILVIGQNLLNAFMRAHIAKFSFDINIRMTYLFSTIDSDATKSRR